MKRVASAWCQTNRVKATGKDGSYLRSLVELVITERHRKSKVESGGICNYEKNGQVHQDKLTRRIASFFEARTPVRRP
jgi:hypothetical protein